MEYTVEKVLAQKRFKQRNGRSMTKYLVKWEGYDDPTWEPVRNLSNCRAKIDEFLASRDESEHADGATDAGQAVDEEAHATDTGADANRIVPSTFMAMLHATTTTHDVDVEQEEKTDDLEEKSPVPGRRTRRRE